MEISGDFWRKTYFCVQFVHPNRLLEGGNHAAESRGAADDAKLGPGLCKRPLSTGLDGFGFDPLNLKALEKLVGGLEHDFYFSIYWE